MNPDVERIRDADIELALSKDESVPDGSASLGAGAALSDQLYRPSSETLGLRGGQPSSFEDAMWGKPPKPQRRCNGLLCCCAGAVLVLVVLVTLTGVAYEEKDVLLPEKYPSFLVVGDWGRYGGQNQAVGARQNQSEVAQVMFQCATHHPVDFVVSVGDNFYESGLTSVADPEFATSFSQIYTGKSLQVPWYVVLGNHDYGESELAAPDTCPATDSDCYFSPLHQLDYRLVQRDTRWNCQRSFDLSFAGGKVDMFFIDTNPFIMAYQNVTWYTRQGGLFQQSWRSELLELQAKLARSKADWKLVIGHHPVHSNGQHGGYPELQQHLQPLFAEYGVQAYLCGHDHHLEHIIPGDGVQYVISGAGSEVRPLKAEGNTSVFGYYGSGFVAAQLKRDSLDLQYMGILDDTLLPLYEVVIPRTKI